jgi:hypothetical protein
MMSYLYFNHLEPFFTIVPKIHKDKMYEWTRYSFDPCRAVVYNGNELINLNRRSDQIELTKALLNGAQMPNDDDFEFKQQMIVIVDLMK